MPDIKKPKQPAPTKAKPQRKYYKPKAKPSVASEVAVAPVVAQPAVAAAPVIKAEEVLARAVPIRTTPIAVVPVEEPKKKGLWSRFVDRLLARDE